MITKDEIISIFEEEGFKSKFLQRFQIDEGIEDPVTGKKAAWTISWQLDTCDFCEYIEVSTSEQLRENLRSEKNQKILQISKTSHLKKKYMKADKFIQTCKTAVDESKAVIAAIKKIGDIKSLSVQPDFYEPSMYCIVNGPDKISEESEYDERCIAGSMEKDIAIGLVTALKESGIVVNHINLLANDGQDLANSHIELIEKHESLQDESEEIKKYLEITKNEISSLKKRLDESLERSILSGDGEGNVTVANPKQFAKIIRVLEGIQDKINRAQNGEAVTGLPISGSSSVSKEVLYLNTIIEMILGAVNG